LKPEKFINYEIGGKLEINPDLLATLAVYRLKRNNVAVTNPITGIADRLVDGQRTNGVELGINGKLTSAWSINGGYAHQDAKLLATASATALNGAIVGMVPKNTISLWNRYDFLPQFGAGLGVSRRSDMFASTSNTVVLPSYTRVDAALFYTVNANYKLQVNVENLTDKKYYQYANGDNNITPGSPRAYRVSLHANF
jgi:catecholate siderophore receptor